MSLANRAFLEVVSLAVIARNGSSGMIGPFANR
jgi:hypothetical protein